MAECGKLALFRKTVKRAMLRRNWLCSANGEAGILRWELALFRQIAVERR